MATSSWRDDDHNLDQAIVLSQVLSLTVGAIEIVHASSSESKLNTEKIYTLIWPQRKPTGKENQNKLLLPVI